MSKQQIICPECTGEKFTDSNMRDRFEYGDGDDAVELCVTVPVQTCDSCGFQFTGGDAEDIRHEEVCRHLGRLPPSRITALREANKLTRAEFAAVTGIGSASLARWETGQLIQGPAHDSLLYLLLDDSNLRKLAARTPDAEFDDTQEHLVAFESESAFRYVKKDDHEVMQRSIHFDLHLH